MIFAIGCALFIVGLLTMVLFGTRSRHWHNSADYMGSLVMTSGLVAAIYSVLSWLSQFLP